MFVSHEAKCATSPSKTGQMQ